MLDEMQAELKRLAAQEVRLSESTGFEPQAGTLIKVEWDEAYWHLAPGELAALLRNLPDGAGPEAVRRTIEKNAIHVWHGPSPGGSRDTTP